MKKTTRCLRLIFAAISFFVILEFNSEAKASVFEIHSKSLKETIGDWIQVIREIEAHILKDETRFYRGTYAEYSIPVSENGLRIVAISSVHSFALHNQELERRAIYGAGLRFPKNSTEGIEVTTYPLVVTQNANQDLSWPWGGVQIGFTLPLDNILGVNAIGLRTLFLTRYQSPDHLRAITEVFFEIPVFESQDSQEFIFQRVSLTPRCIWDVRSDQPEIGDITPRCSIDTKIRFRM